MENKTEKGPERILAKEEVMQVIARFIEGAKVVRELSDGEGLYLLEARAVGGESGEIIQYEYMRKGRFSNNNAALETAIYIMRYDGEMPMGGDKIAVYKSETGEWEEVQ